MTPLRWTLLAAALGIAVMISIGVGAVAIAPSDILHLITGGANDTTLTIVRDVRLPRILLAVGAGAALAMSGATMQGVLRNPLAEPYLLGVSGGAAGGALIINAHRVESPFALAIAAVGGAGAGGGLRPWLAPAGRGRIGPR